MTLKIEIDVPSDMIEQGCGAYYLEKALSAIGFSRTGVSVAALAAYDQGVKDGAGLGPAPAPAAPEADPVAAETDAQEPAEPARKKRRTKAEIEAERQNQANASTVEQAAEVPMISTGEERINPEDAADEAAETEANSDGKLTLDDLRRACGDYEEKFGMAAAVQNLRGIIGKALVEVTDDELPGAIAAVRAAIEKPAEPAPAPAAPLTKKDVMEAMLRYAEKYDGTRDPAKAAFAAEDAGKVFTLLFGADRNKFSLIPEDQDSLARAVAGLDEATAKNPYKRPTA